jgi:hypothetical protein
VLTPLVKETQRTIDRICLLRSILKLCTRIIAQKITTQIETSEQQQGFRSNKFTVSSSINPSTFALLILPKHLAFKVSKDLVVNSPSGILRVQVRDSFGVALDQFVQSEGVRPHRIVGISRVI